MRPHYSKPPVIECVVEFQYNDSLTEKDLKTLKGKFTGEYPVAMEQRSVSVTLDQNASVTSKVEIAGHRFSSTDGTDMLVTSRQALTVSRVPPYPGWEHVFQKAQRAFDTSRSAVGYHAVKRVGVRYINRVDYPSEAKAAAFDPAKLFNVYPHVPDSLPRESAAFATRHEYLHDGGPITVIVQTMRIEPLLVDHLGFVLDIDVMQQKDVPQKPEDLWSLLDQCAKIKNQVFERTVTDLLRARFE